MHVPASTPIPCLETSASALSAIWLRLIDLTILSQISGLRESVFLSSAYLFASAITKMRGWLHRTRHLALAQRDPSGDRT